MSPDVKCIVLLGILMLLFTVVLCNPTGSTPKSTTKKTKSTVSAGHICIETRTEKSLENVTVLYPCLRNYTEVCGWFWSSRNCTKLREGNCTKTELQLVLRNVTDYVCCTGWTRDDQSRCLVPFCKDGCLNGGTCVNKAGSPMCECPAGYSGLRCQNNLNECLSPDPPCDQICVNTVTSYKCKCFDGYVLQADNRSCHKHNATTGAPISGPWKSTGKKQAISNTAVYVMIAIGATLLLLLITSTFYLLVRRKERLAMETILKDRINLSTNDYGNPAFRRFSNEFVLTDRHPQDPIAVYSTRITTDNDVLTNTQNTPNHGANGIVLQPPTEISNYTSEQSYRNSNASSESLNSNDSTGWTNPLFLQARRLDNNRPSTYAMIEEECYSGSNPSGIYTSIPECVQTLEGFDNGESNDYDSFSSGEFDQEAIYENGFVTNLQPPIEIKSVYLHPPSQSPSQSFGSLFCPIEEEHNYESVSDNRDNLQQNGELEYDYVANDDEMFRNRESSFSSQLEPKQTGDEALYEDTDSPNTTLDSTAEEVNDDHYEESPNLTHNYDYATNPQDDEYYEDGTSIKARQSDFQDEYDYVSSQDLTDSNENIETSRTSQQRQSSVDEEFTGPTTYYDDAIFLARGGYLDNHPDITGDLPDYEYVRNSHVTDTSGTDRVSNLSDFAQGENPEDYLNFTGELPEYEYVRNSNVTLTSGRTERTSNVSDVTFGGVDRSSRNSVGSYASISGSDCEVGADEHDYDEIKKRNDDDDGLKDKTEENDDSDYEHVSNIFDRNSQEIDDITDGDKRETERNNTGQKGSEDYDSDYEKVSDVLERNSQEFYVADETIIDDPICRTSGSTKDISIIAADYEPVYDEVCPLESASDEDQDR